MARFQFAERRSIALLCYINFFLYVNRGIIPGAPESFQIFISNSLGVKVSQQNFYLGLLQSIYVASAALFSLPFGYMAFTRKPFQLVTWGLLSWVVGAVVCGLAYTADSYYVLAVGRVFMGAGEAAFQCNAIPFINRHAPKKNSTVWLGMCIASFTVGNALGYIYGSAFAESSLTWAAAFYVEGVLMIPAIACCVFCIPTVLNDVPEVTLGDMAGNLLESSGPNKSLMSHWYGVFTNFPYLLVALGYGAYTFTMGCFATFTPTLLIGLGYYETEADVSIIFGVIVVLCGTVGTLAGGLALDKLTKGNTVPVARRCKLATDMLVILVFGAAVSAIIMSQVTGSQTAVLIMLGVAFTFLAAIVPAENVAVMEMFPEARQPMAIAGNTAIMFIFGDVPSPMVLGWLKDTWAPECGSVHINGRPKLNPKCDEDQEGLRHVMLFATLWLLWGVALWTAAKFALRRKSEKHQSTPIQSPAYTS